MIIDNSKITVFDITEKIEKSNNFIDSSFKAYEIMNSDWYNNEVSDLFWDIIYKCMKVSKLDYNLWFFCFLEEIFSTKVNRFKYKKILKKYIENKKLILMPINEHEKDFKLRMICAINLTYDSQILNKMQKYFNIEPKSYYVLLPKNIHISKIKKFIETQIYNNFNKNNLLEIDRNIYNFLIEEKGIFIEKYNDSTYYEYKGENEGYIIIDPYKLCSLLSQHSNR